WVSLSAAGLPVLFVSSFTSGGWRQVATSVPVAEVLAAEPGQEPWWEMFKHPEAEVVNLKDQAALVLSGQFGLRWKGTLTLAVHANSGVLDVRLRLAPLRPMRLFGLRLAPLMAGEGSFGAAAAEFLDPRQENERNVTAVRWG